MTVVRDDRVLPLTRWSAAALVVALLAGGITLYGFPGSTGDIWAWTIMPPMTPLVMGAGYLASAFFFARAALTRRWHSVESGFVGVMLFAVLLLVATLLHWDRFNHGHPVFWIWLALYVVGPVLVPLFWLRNRRTADQAPSGPVVPRPVRLVVGLVGAVQLTVALVLFAVPAIATARWPWMLTPLTARVVAGFVAATAMTLLAFWWEPRWNALSAGLQAVAIGIVLIVLAVPRAAADFSTPSAAWGFVAALVAALALTAVPAVAVRRTAESRSEPESVPNLTGSEQ